MDKRILKLDSGKRVIMDHIEGYYYHEKTDETIIVVRDTTVSAGKGNITAAIDKLFSRMGYVSVRPGGEL